MALFMIALISDVYNILMVNFVNKIEVTIDNQGLEIRHIAGNKFRIMKKSEKTVKKVVIEEEVVIKENVDIGEVIEEDAPSVETTFEAYEEIPIKKKDKKKKKKKKNLIDDIFSGF